MISIIVACDSNFLIGKKGTNNGMPWINSEDLEHFKKMTMNHTIIMGRKTFEIIGRPLPNRRTIVVSQSYLNILSNQVLVCNQLQPLLKYYKNCNEKIYVCGGASIYKQSLDYVDELIISKIPGTYIGDTYFPKFSLKEFKCVEVILFKTFRLEIYRRVK